MDEVYFLVFPSSFIILAVGPSLSGYEIKVLMITIIAEQEVRQLLVV